MRERSKSIHTGYKAFLGLCMFFAVGFSLSPLVQAQDSPQRTLKKAIGKGTKLFRQKKYAKSAKEFKQALEINPESASAHWNLARSLGMLRLKGKACENAAKKSVIMRHIFKACRIKPRLKRRLRKETAFRSVSDTMAWQRLMGLSPDSTRGVKKILMNVSWYGPASEQGDPIAGIDFRARGKVLIWLKDNTEKLGQKSFEGRWRVKRTRVFIDLTKPIDEKKHFEGELKLTGELWLPGLPAPFTDDPLECVDKGASTQTNP